MSKKTKKHIITVKEAIERVPRSDCYCDGCPFIQIRSFTKRKQAKLVKKNQIFGIPVWYAGEHQLEYCAFLKTYLSIQDHIKDCGINCCYSEDGDPEFHIDPDYQYYLKEKFPEEAELIDQIIKEELDKR